jgi:hypothetical protein
VELTKFDSNIPFQFVLEPNGHNTGNGFYYGGFAVSDMANSSQIDRRLRVASIYEPDKSA